MGEQNHQNKAGGYIQTSTYYGRHWHCRETDIDVSRELPFAMSYAWVSNLTASASDTAT